MSERIVEEGGDSTSKLVHALNTLTAMIKAKAHVLGVPETVVTRYVRGAREVLRRAHFYVASGYVRGVIVSTVATRKPPEHPVVVRDLVTGRPRVVRVGTPLDQAYHYVTVSENVMKCTCPVAVQVASRADRWLEEFLKERAKPLPPAPVFSQHVLCKHTVSGAAYGLATGVIGFTEEFVENIALAVIGVAVAEGYITKKVVETILDMLQQRRRRRH